MSKVRQAKRVGSKAIEPPLVQFPLRVPLRVCSGALYIINRLRKERVVGGVEELEFVGRPVVVEQDCK